MRERETKGKGTEEEEGERKELLGNIVAPGRWRPPCLLVAVIFPGRTAEWTAAVGRRVGAAVVYCSLVSAQKRHLWPRELPLESWPCLNSSAPWLRRSRAEQRSAHSRGTWHARSPLVFHYTQEWKGRTTALGKRLRIPSAFPRLLRSSAVEKRRKERGRGRDEMGDRRSSGSLVELPSSPFGRA